MMDTQQQKGFNWGSFLLGILFILVALLSFQDPVGNLVAIVIVIGAFAIIKGLFEIFVRNKVKEFTGYQSKMPIIIGIIDIVIGLLLLFNIGAGVITLPFVFAFWFLLDSIVGLMTAGAARVFSNGYYWFTVVVNIIGILLGIYLLFNPLSSVLTLSFLVGAYFMLVGITEIVYAFR